MNSFSLSKAYCCLETQITGALQLLVSSHQ